MRAFMTQEIREQARFNDSVQKLAQLAAEV
jgi:hypothetical protein